MGGFSKGFIIDNVLCGGIRVSGNSGTGTTVNVAQE